MNKEELQEYNRLPTLEYTNKRSSTLQPLEIRHSKYPMPPPNKKHLRLYGHVLCPFVEKVRLVLSAKGIKY